MVACTRMLRVSAAICGSIVVIFVIVTMSALLYGYDNLWAFLFSDYVLGILHGS